MTGVQAVYMAAGTLLLILFIVMCVRGNKYASLTENLESGEFPLKSLYTAGFALSHFSLFAMKGKFKDRLLENAKLLYGANYAEYYASVVWAQALSFSLLCLTAGFLLAGASGSALMLMIGVLIGGVFDGYFLTRMNGLVQTRSEECVSELPEIVSTMALLINAGMMLREAWKTIALSKEGIVYSLMRVSLSDMENGMPEVDAIHRFGVLTNAPEVRKFTGALTQSIERGGAELNDFLARQSVEMWTLKKQLMLQKGEAAASKMLLPTALLFVAIIIAVMCGAFGMMF